MSGEGVAEELGNVVGQVRLGTTLNTEFWLPAYKPWWEGKGFQWASDTILNDNAFGGVVWKLEEGVSENNLQKKHTDGRMGS